MSQANTATMTPSLLFSRKPTWHSNSEVFEIKPSVLDSAADPTSVWGNLAEPSRDAFSAIIRRYRALIVTQDIVPRTIGQTAGEIVTSEQTQLTNVIPDTIRGNWQQLAQAGLSEKTYLYILKLASKNAGWRGQGSCPMNSQSLAAFLGLWSQLIEFVMEPEFVLLPHGNLQAEWYKDDHHFVELEFQSNKKILVGIFDGEFIMEGVAPAKEIVPLLRLRGFISIRRSYDGQRKRVKKLQS